MKRTSYSLPVVSGVVAATAVAVLFHLEPVHLSAGSGEPHGKGARRPFLAVAVLSLTYALGRSIFARLAGQSLESWIVSGRALRNRFRLAVLIVSAALAAILGLVAAFGAGDAGFGLVRLAALTLLAAGVTAGFAAIRLWLSGRRTGASAVFAGGGLAFGLGLASLGSGADIRLGAAAESGAATAWLGALALLSISAASAVARRFISHPLVRFAPDQAYLPYAAAVLLLASFAIPFGVYLQAIAAAALLYAVQIYREAGSGGRSKRRYGGSPDGEMDPLSHQFQWRYDLEAVDLAPAELAGYPDPRRPPHRALAAIAPGRQPTHWRYCVVRKSPKSMITLHDVTTRRHRASFGTHPGAPVRFVEKRSVTDLEFRLYDQLMRIEGRPAIAPRLHAFGPDTEAGSPYGFVGFLDYVSGRSILRKEKGDADLLAKAVALITDLPIVPGSQRGLEFEEAIEGLRSARSIDPIAKLFQAREWEEIDRQISEVETYVRGLQPAMRPAHGDLHPLNFFICAEGDDVSIRIVDWERFAGRPVGTDLYHYVIRSIIHDSLGDFMERLALTYAARVERLGVGARDIETAALCAAFWRTTKNLKVRRNEPASLSQNKIVLGETLRRLHAISQG